MKTLESNILNFEYNKIIPSVGSLLISEPYSPDTNFKRSVILLVEHNEEGSFGFILNNPVKTSMKQLIPSFPVDEVVVSIGGPVNNNTVHYIHTYGSRVRESIEILPGLYWGGDFESIKKIVKDEGYDASQLRFFIGYSGWEPSQMSNELNSNFWVVFNADKQRVMHTKHANAWNYYMQKLGGLFKVWVNSPEDPGLN